MSLWRALSGLTSIPDALSWSKWGSSDDPTEDRLREVTAVPRAVGRIYRWGKRKLKGDLDDDVKEAANALIDILREELGLPAYIAEGYRSQSCQDQLYAQGRATPGKVVTWTRESKHTAGRAFDLGFTSYHPNAVPAQWWRVAGEIGEALGLSWGGRWRKPKLDRPHFEA